MSGREMPAALLGDGHVVLNRRGAEICRAALNLAVRGANGRNGGARVDGDLAWLVEVLRLATTVPDEPAPSDDASASASAVAAVASEGSASGAVGAGEGLDTRAVARMLGISDRAVRLACGTGRLRAARVSGHWLIDEADALAYGERRKGGHDDRQAAAVG